MPSSAAIVVPQAMPSVVPGSSISSSRAPPASVTVRRRSRWSSPGAEGTTCTCTPYSREMRRASSSTRWASGGRREIVTSSASRASRSIRETVDRETRSSPAMDSIVRSYP